MKAVSPKPMPKRFHQASWDEPVIFELNLVRQLQQHGCILGQPLARAGVSESESVDCVHVFIPVGAVGTPKIPHKKEDPAPPSGARVILRG